MQRRALILATLLGLIHHSVLPRLAAESADQLRVATEKGEMLVARIPHPLSWWTKNPSRVDLTGDLMLGHAGRDGKPITLHDYNIEQHVLAVGIVLAIALCKL